MIMIMTMSMMTHDMGYYAFSISLVDVLGPEDALTSNCYYFTNSEVEGFPLRAPGLVCSTQAANEKPGILTLSIL